MNYSNGEKVEEKIHFAAMNKISSIDVASSFVRVSRIAAPEGGNKER